MDKNIQFGDRAVAFIDILGFKSFVCEAVAHNKGLTALQELVNTLESALPALNASVSPCVNPALIPEHLYISDCLIISAPLYGSDKDQYDGLASVVMRVIQVAHMLLEEGYLIRGGIDIGPLWHTKENIVGVAYQKAYELETKTSCPRIELSTNAKAHWESHKFFGDSKMCLDYQGVFMVNTLFADFPGYMSSRFKSIEDGYRSYSKIINGKIKSVALESARCKWRWLYEYKSIFMKNGNCCVCGTNDPHKPSAVEIGSM